MKNKNTLAALRFVHCSNRSYVQSNVSLEFRLNLANCAETRLSAGLNLLSWGLPQSNRTVRRQLIKSDPSHTSTIHTGKYRGYRSKGGENTRGEAPRREEQEGETSGELEPGGVPTGGRIYTDSRGNLPSSATACTCWRPDIYGLPGEPP